MEMANLTCPMCRKRVGAWMRKEKKGGGLVNARLWRHIQDNYADYISIKQRGGDDGLNDCKGVKLFIVNKFLKKHTW